MTWYATLTAAILLATASTFYVVFRAMRNALRTKEVIVAEKRYDFEKHPMVVCLVVAFWLLLTALMVSASVAMLSDLPTIIKKSLQQ